MIFISTTKEVTANSKLCKIRRIKVSKFEKIETSNGKYKIIVRMYPFTENRSKIFVDDSELTRIIKYLNPDDNCLDGEYEYIKDLISIKVGKSGKYKFLIEDGNNRVIENIGEIEIHNYKYDKENEKYNLDSVEVFTHLISNASHIRGQKALFVKKDLFFMVDEILRCGVDANTTTKYISKWTSYYGLQASNSIPVTMPKCTVIPDKYMDIEDIVDVVRQDYKKGYNAKSEEVDKFKYTVDKDIKRIVKTCPFDGMGIVDVDMAEKWARDLGLDYVPGSFQIRLCGVKGCLFVMPVREFIEKVSKTSKLVDIDGNIQDYANGDFNVILTESMFKYKKFYNEKNKVEQWKREFHKELYGYKRTFNICSFAIKYDDMKDTMLTAYQPLQTLDELLDLEKADREQRLNSLCGRTVEVIKNMHSDIAAFLKYIGIEEDGERNKESVKPYYRALSVNHSLCNDKYIRMKMERTLKSAKEKTYVGKLYMDGNYAVVGSDPYALLQHAFGLEVTGLLGRDEVYTNYWNQRGVSSINIWRNPHIFREHWIGKCINNKDICEWFRYMDTNIIVSIWDTNLLRCNSADTDGDILAQVNNDILKWEVDKVLKSGKARTIFPDLICERESNDDIPDVSISDTKAIIESEIRGFGNDIGEVINKISELWGEKQSGTTEEYIKILSVVGSLVIDFVKTGVKVPIPSDISKYIKDNKIKKPCFMMFLPNNKKARKKEENDYKAYEKEKKDSEAKGVTFDKEFVSKFSDKPCTLNTIMDYMKRNLDEVEFSFNEPEFDYSILIKSRDCNLDKKVQYVKIRNLFKEYVKEQKNISDEHKQEADKCANVKEEYNMIYKAFYDKCRNELLCVCNETGKVCTKSMILDCCIMCCYTEFDERNYSHFDLLWNLFPDELVKRASGKDIIQKKSKKNEENFKKSLEVKREKSNQKYVTQRDNKKNKIECLESDKGTPDIFNIYKSEITYIKNRIPTSVEHYIDVRKVYYCFLVAYKRLRSINKLMAVPCLENSKNDFTYSCIAQITKLSNRKVKRAVEILEEMELIRMHKGNNFKRCELLFIPKEKNIDDFYYSGIDYMKAFKVANRYLGR